MISHISFISLVNQIVFLSLLIPTKSTITKVHHLISSRFERSEHKKSQCGLHTSVTKYQKEIKWSGPKRGSFCKVVTSSSLITQQLPSSCVSQPEKSTPPCIKQDKNQIINLFVLSFCYFVISLFHHFVIWCFGGLVIWCNGVLVIWWFSGLVVE